MKIITNLSPNYDPMKKRVIKYIIIHYTGMRSAHESIKRLKSKKYKVSSHYFIDRLGIVSQLVMDSNVAWHAGVSFWGRDKNLNKNSIGIELQNRGYEFGYEKYTKKQIRSLIYLLSNLKEKYNVSDSFILGHSDIASFRKSDPGYLFPWNELAKKGIGLTLKKKLKSKKVLTVNQITKLQKLFSEFGYKISINGLLDQETLHVIHAFESHFCPEELDEFSVKEKIMAYLKALIKAKKQNLTKKR